MLPRILTQADYACAESLVSTPAYEGRGLEFKERLHDLKDDKGSNEAIYDVIAFANSDGGDLIFGVAEVNEAATKLLGIPQADIKNFRDTLFARLSSGVEPPLPAPEDKVIPVPGTSSCVYVLRIPPSAIGPHRDRKTSLFYERNARGKNPMDMQAIRRAILQQSVAFEEFERFRTQRVRLLSKDRHDGKGSLGVYPVACLHIAPTRALTKYSRRFVDFSTFRPDQNVSLPDGIASDEGYYCSEGFRRIAIPTSETGGTITQIFRDGTIEIATGGKLWKRGSSTFRLLVESDLVGLIDCGYEHLKMLHEHLGVMPCLAGVSFWGLKDSTLGVFNGGLLHALGASTDELFCHEVSIETMPTSAFDLGQVLSKSLDALYNVFDLPSSRLPVTADAWTKMAQRGG